MKTKIIFSLTHLILAFICGSIITSCNNIEYPYQGPLKGFTMVGDSKDNWEADTLIIGPEKQTISLKIKTLRFEGINPKIKAIRVLADTDSCYDEMARFYTHGKYYKAYVDLDITGNPYVVVEIEANESDKIRNFYIDVHTDAIYEYRPIVGGVEIIQYPQNQEQEGYTLRAKYKNKIYQTKARTDLDGNIRHSSF